MEEISGFVNLLVSLIKDGIDIEGAGHFINAALPNEYLITNVGLLPFDTNYDQLKLDAIWGPFLPPGYDGSQTIGVATINGSIRLTLTALQHTEVKPIFELMEQILNVECA
jgi:hypothetical protein